jgi:cell division protein FtsQ
MSAAHATACAPRAHLTVTRRRRAGSRCYSHIAVVRNLRGRETGLTMPRSMFRPRRNRRKVDLAKKTSEMKASVRHHGPAIVKALGATVLSVGLVWGGWQGWGWATTTDRFGLQQIRVVGNARVTDAQVTKLGGLVLGSNLIAMDVGSVERALSSHPWVKSVSAHRTLPDRLTVELVEHEPVALIALGDLYLVNADGQPFKRAQAGEGMDLPLLTGVEREALLERPDETRATIRRALTALDAYARSPASKGFGASEVNVSDFGLTLVTTSGQEVVLGDADVEPALERLTRVRKELSAKQLSAEVIRLDNRTRPDWVAVRTSNRNGPKP